MNSHMSARQRTGWLRRRGEDFMPMDPTITPIRGHLHHDSNILTVDIGTVIPPGTIVTRKRDCQYYLCYQQIDVNGLHRESPTRRCTHLAAVSRPTGNTKDSFGRPTGSPENIIAAVPLALVSREILQAGDKAQSGIRWHLTFDTSAAYDLKKGDAMCTATVTTTILSIAELVDGILTINAIAVSA